MGLHIDYRLKPFQKSILFDATKHLKQIGEVPLLFFYLSVWMMSMNICIKYIDRQIKIPYMYVISFM